ncbi:MAG: serine/threonine protein kinase [Polyangiaceae bacterium]|nr:serine/threonine protein kinase [Polyangiaceae bacterium]
MPDAPVQPGDLLAGKYRVERVLGAGGMGVVVAAWHLELEQRVAMKFLLPELAERSDAAERFRREARAAVKIRSEHVARVLDVGTMSEPPVPYMVMEYLEGRDLAAELRERQQLPVEEACEYVLQASEAVAEAHSAGIVHRDLKPGNLHLSRRADGTAIVKVLDFGISKALASTSELSLTRTASIVGSPLYMSPEQMRNSKDVDVRADIWSLSAILFELVAGRPPFLAETIPELCSLLLTEDPPPLAQFRSDAPAALEAAVRRGLERDRARRWASVAELAAALSELAPAGRVHAERAARLLGTSPGVRAGSLPGDSQAGAQPAPSLAAAAASGAATEVGDPGGLTAASWGRTGPAPAEGAAPSRRSGLALAAVGAAIVVGGAAAWLGAGSAAPPAAAPSAASAAAPSVPLPAATLPAPEASAANPAPPVGSAPAVPAAPAGVAPTAPAAAASARGRAAPRGAPPPRPDTGVTDFGGRR